MRLFVAVHFSAEVRAMLMDTIGELRAMGAKGNSTRPENLHLTLAFIGETDQVSKAVGAVDSAVSPPFTMTVGGLGRFGDLYWVGIDENNKLAALALGLQESLRAAGFDIERRAWKPHITIARRVIAETPLRLQVPKIEMPVDKVSLMRSDRIAGKMKYTEVFGKSLGA